MDSRFPKLGSMDAPPNPDPSPAARERLNATLGLLRSLAIYRRPGRQRALRRLYRPFIGRDDRVFDIGAHLGDRTLAFSRLGGHVIAVEPQPVLRRWLERGPGRRRNVTVRGEAVGAEPGTADLHISHRTPTVSTLSQRWTDELPRRNDGFRGVRWEDHLQVPVITLDDLIAEYGLPAFCKIDVEGYEVEVLSGLSQPIPALSLEFVAGALDIAIAGMERLAELGDYEFNVIAGEQREYRFARWQDRGRVRLWLEAHAADYGSGDLYARLRMPHARS